MEVGLNIDSVPLPAVSTAESQEIMEVSFFTMNDVVVTPLAAMVAIGGSPGTLNIILLVSSPLPMTLSWATYLSPEVNGIPR